MSTLSIKRVKEALSKIQYVAYVEEAFEIAGVSVVLRSLLPDEYPKVLAEVGDLEDQAFIYAFWSETLARSIVEVGDLDLREIDFVEVEIDGPGGVKVGKVEKVAFLRDQVLATWSRDALFVGYTKFTEVEGKSEAKAKAGVAFSKADDSGIDRFKRALADLKEAQADLPAELASKLLLDVGLIKSEYRADRGVALGGSEATNVPEPQPVQEEETEAPEPQVVKTPRPMRTKVTVAPPTPEVEAAKPRQPLNRGDMIPTIPTPDWVNVPRSAVAAERAAQYQELDQELPQAPSLVQPKLEPVVIAVQQPKRDLLTAAAAVDAPSNRGLNPRFQPRR